MSLAQGNNTPTRPRIEPGSPDPESDALTTRPVRSRKERCMYYDNSHLIENDHLIFHINDYKAHFSYLPSQFVKLISIGLNICIKIAVFSQNYTATAAKFDE